MTLLRVLIASLLFVILPVVTGAADNGKEQSDPALNKAIVDGFTKAAEIYEKADAKDIEAYQYTVSEAMAFIIYLSKCQKVIPVSEHGTSSISTLPPSFELKLRYPLTMKAEIAPKPETDTLTILLLSKETNTSSWKLFDGWVQTKSGEKKDKVAIPAAAVQKKANDAVPRLLKELDECRCD